MIWTILMTLSWQLPKHRVLSCWRLRWRLIMIFLKIANFSKSLKSVGCEVYKSQPQIIWWNYHHLLIYDGPKFSTVCLTKLLVLHWNSLQRNYELSQKCEFFKIPLVNHLLEVHKSYQKGTICHNLLLIYDYVPKV